MVDMVVVGKCGWGEKKGSLNNFLYFFSFRNKVIM
jgi:hypothetical protein